MKRLGQTEDSKCRAWSILRGKPVCGKEGLEGEREGLGFGVGEELTVDEKTAFGVAVLVSAPHDLRHGVFEQLHRDFHGHDDAFADVLFDHLAELAAFPFLLRAQQVPRR